MSVDGVTPGAGNIPQERLPEDAERIKSKPIVNAGNLKGANLEISELATETKSGSVGSRKASLQSPSSEIALKTYEQTATVLNNLSTQLNVDGHAAAFEVLAQSVSTTGTGKGGGGVQAATIRLNNSTPEQTKEWGDKLQKISWELSTLGFDDATQFKETEVAIGRLYEALNDDRSSDAEITTRLDAVQQSLERGGFTFDSSAKAEHLHQLLDNLGPPGPADAKAINMITSEKGLSATLDNNTSLKANFEKKTMEMNIDGKKLEYNFDQNGEPKITIDGEPSGFDAHETRIFSDFFQLMELFHEMGTTMRRQHREGRNAAQEIVVGKIKDQAGKQREAATKAFVAGVVSASTKMASGLIQLRGSAQAFKAARGGNNALAESLSGRARGISSLVEGLGESGAALGRYQSSIAESEGTLLRADEEQARYVKQTEQDQMEIAKELTSKARETFSQVWNSIIQAQSKISGNI